MKIKVKHLTINWNMCLVPNVSLMMKGYNYVLGDSNNYDNRAECTEVNRQVVG